MRLIHILSLALFVSSVWAQAPISPVKLISKDAVIDAVLKGDIEVVTMALKQGVDVETRDKQQRTLLMYAAFNGKVDVVRLLVEAGADVNAQDEAGTSPLMFAASGPAHKTVQYLIDHGAKINQVDNNEHFSALMWAAAEGQKENVELLLKAKADHTLQDIDGDTAESFATKAGHAAVSALLKEHAESAKVHR